MLPTRFSSLGLTRCIRGLGLLLLASTIAVQLKAGPLPGNGFEDFKVLLDPKSSLNKIEPRTAEELTDRRRAFFKAANQLPALGEVARVLLLTDWETTSSSLDDLDVPKVPLDQIKASMKLSDEAFQKEVADMLKKAGDDSGKVASAVLTEIRRTVRVDLEERLQKDLRFYFKSKQAADRIAAANLIRDTITNSRRQEQTSLGVEGGFARPGTTTTGGRSFRESFRVLAGEVEVLSHDSDPNVRIAAVRVLSEEPDVALSAHAFRPLLNAEANNVTVRRAAAEAIAHAVEVMASRLDRSRPQPLLHGVERILPVAVTGLTDEDIGVRKSCLSACQRAALLMDDVASERRTAAERFALFKPAMAVVNQNLPAINQAARDRTPEVRYMACHVLEELVLVANKVRNPAEQTLPAPGGLPPTKSGPPGIDPSKKKKTGVWAPSPRGPQHATGSRPSQWASARDGQLPQQARPTVPPASEAVAAAVSLERPVKLTGNERTRQPVIRRASYNARQQEEVLPEPTLVDPGFHVTLDAMIQNLSDRDYRVRLAAVDVLETLGDAAAPAIPALVKALGDTNKFVRWSSARTLGRLAPRRADEVVPGLVALLNDREDQSVRMTAAVALEQYGPAAKAAVPHLAHAINRGDKEYIIHIMQTIQAIGSDAVPALPNVAWILESRELPASVRVEAAQTLARFGPLAKDQLAALRDVMIHETDESVRNAASNAVLAIDQKKK